MDPKTVNPGKDSVVPATNGDVQPQNVNKEGANPTADNRIPLSPEELGALREGIRREMRDTYIGTISKKSKELEEKTKAFNELQAQFEASKKERQAPTWADIELANKIRAEEVSLKNLESETKVGVEKETESFINENSELKDYRSQFDEVRANFPEMNLDKVKKLVLAEMNPELLLKKESPKPKINLGQPKTQSSPSKDGLPSVEEVKNASTLDDAFAAFQKIYTYGN